MRYGSLFSGIGGMDLGLDRAGMECAWQVEIDEWCRKVLTKHWPDVPKYGDIKELSGEELEPVDLIAGGFPCQPVSVSGYRHGNRDERWLWPAFARILRCLRPEYALVENVPGLLDRGMGEVLGDLAEAGYDAEWASIPAAAFGAPHLRHRIFILAHRDGERIKGCWTGQIQRVAGFSWSEGVRGIEDLQGRPDLPEPLVRRMVDGLSRRVDGLGNAVVPQVAEFIGKRIIESRA